MNILFYGQLRWCEHLLNATHISGIIHNALQVFHLRCNDVILSRRLHFKLVINISDDIFLHGCFDLGFFFLLLLWVSTPGSGN